MTWDLGWQGLGYLALMAIAFGLVTELLLARWTGWWVGLVATFAGFVCGLLVSEVWFGWATEEELQPNIDGLSRDEVLLIVGPIGIGIVLVIRYFAKRHRLAEGHANGRTLHA
jgi:MFS family permease